MSQCVTVKCILDRRGDLWVAVRQMSEGSTHDAKVMWVGLRVTKSRDWVLRLDYCWIVKYHIDAEI